jgi:hypothetical protein
MKSKGTKQILLWSLVLILAGLLLLVGQFTEIGAWVWFAVLAVGGLCALGLFLTDRSDWLVLLAAYVLWTIAVLIAVEALDFLPDVAISVYVLLVIACPFLAVYLRNRSQWWWLIPAYVLAAVGGVVVLAEAAGVGENLITAYVMFAIAAPFFVVYVRNRSQWWFLIPGGIMAAIGIGFLLAENAFAILGALALIALGLWSLVRGFARREPPGDA